MNFYHCRVDEQTELSDSREATPALRGRGGSISKHVLTLSSEILLLGFYSLKIRYLKYTILYIFYLY